MLQKLGMVVMVLVLASSAAAEPACMITNLTYDGSYNMGRIYFDTGSDSWVNEGFASRSVFYFDVVLTGLDAGTTLDAAGFQFGATLSDASGLGLSVDPALDRYIASTTFYGLDAPLTTPTAIPPTETNWAWNDFGTLQSTAKADGTDDGALQPDVSTLIEWLMPSSSGTTEVGNGDILCRLFYAWDSGVNGDPADPTINLTGYEGDTYPAIVLDVNTYQDLPVVVPEPGTMALLGLGMFVLALRRPRVKK